MSKLLRVLVAGGMALAGVGATRADDKDASAATSTEQAGKGTANDERQDKPEAQKAAKEDKDKKKADDDKKGNDKKAEESSGGGVKGW